MNTILLNRLRVSHVITYGFIFGWSVYTLAAAVVQIILSLDLELAHLISTVNYTLRNLAVHESMYEAWLNDNEVVFYSP